MNSWIMNGLSRMCQEYLLRSPAREEPAKSIGSVFLPTQWTALLTAANFISRRHFCRLRLNSSIPALSARSADDEKKRKKKKFKLAGPVLI